ASTPIGYRDIQAAIKRSGVSGNIPIESIRVAASELRNGLERLGSRFRLSDVPAGREKRFSLRYAPQHLFEVIADLSPPVHETAEEIALNLVTENVLPSRSLYCLPYAAHSWIVHSHRQSELRNQLVESSVCHRLLTADKKAFAEFVASFKEQKRLTVIGLGVGEGLGEISLLSEVLRYTATDHVTIDYLCVDRSPLLLFSHIEEIKETFSRQLGRRIRCTGVCGDYSELDSVIDRARSIASQKGCTDFAPHFSPAAITLFGNVLGNSPGDECNLIRQIRSSVRNRPLAIAIGISTPNPDESYTDESFEFFAATPRQVLKHHGTPAESGMNTWSLQSSVPDEFHIPFDPSSPSRLLTSGKRISLQHVTDYASTDRSGAKLAGELFNFKYLLQGDLTFRDDRIAETAVAGTEILLYSVTKLELESLQELLERIGFDTISYGPVDIQLDAKSQTRKYGIVIAVTS
ncbi:MAG: hypothetical protein H6824_21525, partial [Planctomycetaceae bacterium]|nr:hypothetical protein [Planctomycetaceae bacterium]